jgi:hypothetical protein
MAGNKNSGRKPHTNVAAGVQQSIDAAAPGAIKYLIASLARIGKIDRQRIEIAIYIINQHLGIPRAKIEVSGRDGEKLVSTFIFQMPDGSTKTAQDMANQD